MEMACEALAGVLASEAKKNIVLFARGRHDPDKLFFVFMINWRVEEGWRRVMLYYYAVREMSLEQILHLLGVIVEHIQAQNPACPSK